MNELNGKYTVVDEFPVKDQKVLVLNEDRKSDDYNTSKITIDGELLDYSLTHVMRWIMVKTDRKFVGKELEFVR